MKSIKARQAWLFVVQSRVGLVIRTTPGYWSLITTIKHPSIAGREKEVIKTLAEPNEVRVSRTDESVYLFYRTAGKKHLCVVVKRADAKTGFIITAYVAERIKEGRVVWRK